MERFSSTDTGTNISKSVVGLRNAIRAGDISFTLHVVKEGERLDQIAHRTYGDGTMWWVIAAASNIGWWLQVPPGTVLRIPDREVVER